MLADDILDYLPDSVAVTDPEGNILYRNQSWRETAFAQQ